MAPKVESTLPNLLAFCRTFEHGSFTLAARALSVTPAAVSRAIARLEATLGVSLFRRTTRTVRPTVEGRAYYEKCAAALALLAEAEEELAEATSEISGLVRVSAPTTYGLHRLVPRLGGFHQKHPGIELELDISNHNTELVREGVDLAIRMGTISEAGMVARKLGDFPLGVFAAPSYLRRHGEPVTIEELEHHRCITFLLPRTGLALPWLFNGPAAELAVRSSVRVLGDPNGAIGLARAGEGIIQAYRFLVERELAAGQLVELFGERGGRTRHFSLIYRKERARSRAVRAVIAYVLAAEA